MKTEIALNKAESDIIWRERFPKTETWNCVRLLVESGRRDLESCSMHKWGQACFILTGYQKGFNECYFQPFPGFPRFMFSPFTGTSQQSPSQASVYAPKTCSCLEKGGKRTSFLLLLFEAHPIVKRMFGLSFCSVVPSQMPQRSVTGEDLLAKSSFYQSNEPEEDGN